MYGEKIRKRAFDLYAIHKSLSKVVTELQKEYSACKNIDRKTLGKWRHEDGWDEHIQQARIRQYETQSDKLVDEFSDMSKLLVDQMRSVVTAMMGLDPKSYGEAVHSLPSLFALIKNLSGKGEETNREETIGRTLKALKSVDSFAHLLEDPDNYRQMMRAIEVEFGEA